MKIENVKINGKSFPMGIDGSVLTCSWKVTGSKSKKQKTAGIRVAADPEMKEVVYTAAGEDLDSCGTELKWKAEPLTRYYYQISVTGDAGDCAESEVHWFETGRMGTPWNAAWITTEKEEDDFHPEFRKSFSIHEKVVSAKLCITGLGLFHAEINGRPVSDDFLAPWLTDYSEEVQTCLYDVTDLLNEENTIAVTLGSGWYKGRFGLAGQVHPDYPFGLIAELSVLCEDGTTYTIGTDDTWTYRKSAWLRSDIYDGEIQDWTSVSNAEKGAVLLDTAVRTVDRYSLPVHVMETFPVAEVIHTPAGETVLDFGQEFAGFVRIEQEIPKGVTLKLEFGEILQDGNFYHDNYRTAVSEFLYTSDGIPRVIEPRFTFFGFRYVKVTGLEDIDPSAFTGCAVYSEMEQTGSITTGHKGINRLILNSLWGMKSNFLDMPTDCPQRDERLGWCGDAQVFCTTAGFHMDTRAFYAKFLRDLRLDQEKNDGKVAIYLPNEFPVLAASVWSDIGTFLPEMVYRYYGDITLLKENYPLMRDWVDYIHRTDCERGEQDLYNWGFQFGDWLALDGPTEQSRFGRTDSYYVASMYYYASVLYTAKAAAILGYKEDEQKWNELASKIREAILDEYFTKSGRLAIDTQTGYLLALNFGIWREKQTLIDGLKKRFQQDCYKIKGGFVGATMMNRVLCENGMEDIAYLFLFNKDFPGWLYEVDHGATTIWERWNSVLPDGHLSGTSMNSLNHYSYGSVVESLYRYAAGINETSPGFRTARIAPLPDIRFGQLTCTFDSACGTYRSEWEIQKDGSVRYEIEVPFGCEAEIVLPGREPETVSAGIYRYHVVTERDYAALYRAETPFRVLLEDDRAAAVLEECIPDYMATLDRADAEAMSKSLINARIQAVLFRTPTEGIDHAIEEIGKIRGE